MILYIDTNALIYSLTAKPEFKDPARNWLDSFARAPGSLHVTSRLTILEALIGPAAYTAKRRSGSAIKRTGTRPTRHGARRTACAIG